MPAIILAAGASRRLGQPKQLVRIGSETLLERTVRLVREFGANPVFVVLGAHRETIVGAVDLSHIQTIVNPHWEQGIASSIHAGLQVLQRSAPAAAGALLLVCDQPRLTVKHLNELADSFEQNDQSAIVASEYAGVAGIPAIFPASQFPELFALEGDTGARQVLRNPKCAMITVHFEGGEIDVDSPSDLPRISALSPQV